MKRSRSISFAILLVAALAVLAGCNDKRTMISSILQQPDRYVNKEVAVAGDVTQSYAVNLLVTELGAYQVDDGSGKIWVVTRTGVPAQGVKVGLKGTVGSGIKIGREVFGTVIQEKERRTR